MSVGYRAIQWLPYKKRYDLVVASLILAYVAVFFVVSKLTWRGDRSISDEIMILRALGSCAYAMLSLTLCIGPLARLDRRFLPLLYNRRHLGVATFLIGLLHGLLAFGFYHGFGRISPVISLLTSNTQYRSISAFPFEILGLIALVILFLMAATSHDFWLKNLSPGVWKALHMLVYPAWGLLVMHVALGALQSERSTILSASLIMSVVIVCGLHLVAAHRGRQVDVQHDAWIDAGAIDKIASGRAKVLKPVGRERIALYRHGDEFCAIGNVCAHQGGPLGEGRIIDGCVTCPWHGYQYVPETGKSPPPFTEQVPTYPVKIENGRVFVRIEPEEVRDGG